MAAHFSRHKDLTKVAGNPTRDLDKTYNELMAIDDPSILAYRVTQLFSARVGKGISERNWDKFRRTVENLSSDLTGLRFYLTNYLLAASGLATVK